MNSSEDKKLIFEELNKLTTEQRNPKSMGIDSLSTMEILKIINDEDKTVSTSVEKELKYIEQAVEIIVNAIKKYATEYSKY